MAKSVKRLDENDGKKANISEVPIIKIPKIKKQNRNSKPSQKKKKNRNSKPSKRKKNNDNSKPCKKNRKNRNSKLPRTKIEYSTLKTNKVKKNQYTKPSAKNRHTYGSKLSNKRTDTNETPSDLFNIKLPMEEHLECSEIHDFLKKKVFFFNNNIFHFNEKLCIRYFLTVLHQWLPCICCTSIYPENQLKVATEKHILYHDVHKDQLLCRKCIEFIPSDNYPHCPYARYKNKFEISLIPEDLILGFIEQRAITLTHIYMSIILIRGRQAALKGQIVHFHVDNDVIVGDLLPFPRCYEFLAVVQEKPHTIKEIRTTKKKLMTMDEIQKMFECRKDNIIPIQIIDSYAYNNATTIAPVVNCSETLYGPQRIMACAENPTWQIEPYLEEKCYPWLYPHGKGGEADPERPLQINTRDYYKQRLKSSDNRWQKDPTWIFRALNLLQREDLRKSVNYHARKKYEDGKMCYLIYPDIGMVIRGSSAFWEKARRHLRSMYATLGKPFIFLSINLQDDVEFLTNINPVKFGMIDNPNWEAIDSLNNDEYLMLINQNAALAARMCKRRIAGFEEFIKDKQHPFLINYVVPNYFLKIEFQRDGLPHIHSLLWVENPPSYESIEGRQIIIDFVDTFLTTELPDRDVDPDLYKGKKQTTAGQECEKKDKNIDINAINRNNEDEIYEKVDVENDLDLIQTNLEKREFFERARCRFGKPDPLAAETHFRTHKQARILTRGDRDIIMKRTTEEVMIIQWLPKLSNKQSHVFFSLYISDITK
ncbi:unnamed protein product, partial [Rotaria socialis]